MWITRAALPFVLVLAACGGKSKPPADPGGGGSGTGTPPPVTVDVSKLGSACGDDGTCPDGTLCARYYGIAGPSGPEFSSCEVACDTGQACPDGSACTTIADGPGAVCRASETPPPVTAE